MNPRTGYSILEVLVAFAIMSITLAVLIPGQTQLLSRASESANRALAHDLAMSRLEEAQVLGVPTTETYRGWRLSSVLTEGQTTRTITVTVKTRAGRTLATAKRTMANPDAN